MIANTVPIIPTAKTAPTISYSSVIDIPEDREELFICENVTVFDIFAPLTVMEPDADIAEYPEILPTE